MMLMTCIAKEFSKATGFPTIITMVLSGFLIGVIADQQEFISEISEKWEKISLNLAFTLFYPGTIFLVGYLADFYMFKKEFWKITILGSLGSILNIFFMKIIL